MSIDCINCGAPLPEKSDRCRHCDTLNDTDARRLNEAPAEVPERYRKGERKKERER